MSLNMSNEGKQLIDKSGWGTEISIPEGRKLSESELNTLCQSANLRDAGDHNGARRLRDSVLGSERVTLLPGPSVQGDFNS